jgi:hypothetical protein
MCADVICSGVIDVTATALVVVRAGVNHGWADSKDSEDDALRK